MSCIQLLSLLTLSASLLIIMSYSSYSDLKSANILIDSTFRAKVSASIPVMLNRTEYVCGALLNKEAIGHNQVIYTISFCTFTKKPPPSFPCNGSHRLLILDSLLRKRLT